MIIWITGNTGAGKTTLARKLKRANTIILDGDEVREAIGQGFKLTKEDRRENNLKIARLAKLLEGQGFTVIVSVICPYESLRGEVKQITGCVFYYVPYVGDDSREGCPYERPLNPDVTLPERDIGL